ncbi:FAD-dependent monooxygenase [Streptomyces sp. NPDC002143]
MAVHRGTHDDLHAEQGALPGEHPGRAANPSVTVHDLAWLEFAKPDLDRAEAFGRAFGRAFGFVTSYRDGREPHLRGTQAGAPCVIIRKDRRSRLLGPAFRAADTLICCGWETRSAPGCSRRPRRWAGRWSRRSTPVGCGCGSSPTRTNCPPCRGRSRSASTSPVTSTGSTAPSGRLVSRPVSGAWGRWSCSRRLPALDLEPWMRVSQVILDQVILEPALRDLLEDRAKHVTVQYGWGLESFEEDADGVTAHLVSADGTRRRTVRARYLAGCDGAGSRTRKQLGIGLDEIDLRKLVVKELGLPRTVATLARAFRERRERPADGRFYLVHFTTRDPRVLNRFGTGWHLQSPDGWTLISQNDGDTFTLHAPLGIGVDADRIDPREFLYERLGCRFESDVLVANAWTPRLTVADSFGRGRVWLAGDAVHQVTPTGGYGMNTGVGDAIGLGWALAAVLQSWGAPGLLGAYAQERRSVALRNRRAAARHALVRAAVMTANRADLHSERRLGARTRQRVGREISDLGNLENEALGIELGHRYDTSPAVCPDTAAERGVPLEVVDVRDPHARALYERDLVLVRPDQHVAWRGDEPPADPLHVIDRMRGAKT